MCRAKSLNECGVRRKKRKRKRKRKGRDRKAGGGSRYGGGLSRLPNSVTHSAGCSSYKLVPSNPGIFHGNFMDLATTTCGWYDWSCCCVPVAPVPVLVDSPFLCTSAEFFPCQHHLLSCTSTMKSSVRPATKRTATPILKSNSIVIVMIVIARLELFHHCQILWRCHRGHHFQQLQKLKTSFR